jgi:chromate transporter
VVVASLALMGVVAFQLGRAAIVSWQTALIAIISGILLLRWKVNSAWLILAAAAVGLVLN